METDPREVAILKIKELLRHPDDLQTKIDMVRKRLQSEQMNMDAQLKAVATGQLDEIQRGLDLLENVSSNTETLKNRLKGITGLHKPADDMEENFALISQISQINANMVTTRQMVHNFTEWTERLDQVEGIFEEQKQAGTISPANLLRLHYRLSQLEEFRDQVMLKAQNISPDAQRTLEQYFGRLDILSAYFSDFFWSLVENIFEYATSEEGALIVSMAKIVEAEERADEKQFRLWRSTVSDDVPDEEGPAPRGFKERLFGIITEIVDGRFQMWAQDFEEDLYECLEATGFVMDDLMVVYDYVVPRFPKQWRIFQFFCLEYHKQLNNVVAQVAESNLDAGQILRLLRWTRDYYSEMKKQLGISEKSLEPRILHEQEPLLIRDYLRLVRSKVDEWMSNLTRTVIQEFRERPNQPEVDADGRYGMSAAVIVFQVVNQQVDVATEANRGQLLCDVVGECAEALKVTQESWKRLMQTETQQFLSGANIPIGLVEYTIALANEQLRCVEFCDSIAERLTGMVSNKYAIIISRSLDEAMGGFLDVGGHACHQLVDIVFYDLVSVFGQLFCPQWYQEDLMILLVDTLRDYCDDFRDTLKEYLFMRLLNEMMDRFLLEYALAMAINRGAMFKFPSSRMKFKSDMDAVMAFFSQELPADQVQEEFDPIIKLTNFVIAGSDILFLEFHQLRKKYPDFELGFAEQILARREGMSKANLAEIVGTMKAKLDTRTKADHPSLFGIVAQELNKRN